MVWGGSRGGGGGEELADPSTGIRKAFLIVGWCHLHDRLRPMREVIGWLAVESDKQPALAKQ